MPETEASVPRPKDPRHVRAGVAGMRARWGDTPRAVRLHDLPPAVARAVVALVDASRKEKDARASDDSRASAPEVHGNARPAA